MKQRPRVIPNPMLHTQRTLERRNRRAGIVSPRDKRKAWRKRIHGLMPKGDSDPGSRDRTLRGKQRIKARKAARRAA